MEKINNKNLIAYSLLAFSISFIGLPIYIYLPNYYINNFNIGLKEMGLILLFTRFIDAIQDPVFGIASDKYLRKKKILIVLLSPLLGFSFLFLFNPSPSFNIIIWLTIFLIITYSFYSFIYVNYQSYAISFSNDYHTKTKIIAYREIFFTLGLTTAAISPALLFKFFSEIIAFKIIGIIYLVLIIFFSIIFYLKAPNIKIRENKNFSYFAIFKNSILRKFFIMFFYNAMAAAIPAVLIMFFVEKIINASDYISLFLLLYFIGLFFGVFVWSKLSKKIGNKVKTFLISMIFTSFIFSFCFFVKQGDVLIYALICFISAIGFGGDFTLSYSIMTDIIQTEKLQQNEASIFGITNFIIKLSLSVSSGILIYIMGILEFLENIQHIFIKYSYIFLPVIFRLLAALTLFKNFKISKFD